ncbi:MAG: DUF3160 domain-containing protein [Chitinivibrionales bacterium]|nr:DUF3160 domain-containing protein [Chitinivibrionales bacterium]
MVNDTVMAGRNTFSIPGKELAMKTVSAFGCAVILTVSLAGYAIEVITNDIATEFAVYQAQSQSFAPSVEPYTINPDLSNVHFADHYDLSPDAAAKLVQNGFVAVPTNADNIYEVYKETRDAALPVFVTTDAMLHSFHIIYDYMLRIAEHERFYFELDEMLGALQMELSPLLAFQGDDSLKTAIIRTAAFLETAHRLLTETKTDTSEPVETWVTGELALIEAHQGFDSSKVLKELYEDFSQYVPRGHYTRNDRFKRFFKSMMYLGRMNFRLTTPDDPSIARLETMQACLLTRLLATATGAADKWEHIYQPTVFFVGRSDDLNFKEYKEVLDRVLGAGWINGDISDLSDNLGDILDELRKLRPPMIQSGFVLDTEDFSEVTKGFRVMGQRFIPDSYMLWKLVYSNVGTQGNPRLMPRGLDVFAVLGSERAYHHLTELYNDDMYDGYVDTLAALRQEFASRPAAQWAENLYWNWLYVLVPLLEKVGDGFPFFMTTTAWADKTLTTASGSWAELRHDTILYAKQSYTSWVTSLPPPPIEGPMRQGYVEPNPEVFGRLAALGRFMKEGFLNSSLSDVLPLEKLDSFASLCTSLQGIAIKELEGGNITSTEYNATVGNIGPALQALQDFTDYSFTTPQEQQQGITSDADSAMAIIADVHTDPNSQRVLEVGVGKAMDVYVAAPVEGAIVLCRGAMFSYYEFPHPMNDRLTDEGWQGMLANGSAPSMPEWTRGFQYDSTHTQTLGGYDRIKSIQVEVVNRYQPGEEITITIGASEVQSVTVTSSAGDSRSLTPVASGQRAYSALVPPDLLESQSLTVEVKADNVGYRKLLENRAASPVKKGPVEFASAKEVRTCGRRLVLPRSGRWSLYAPDGRKIIDIPEEAGVYTIPEGIAARILFLAGQGRGENAVYRIVAE